MNALSPVFNSVGAISILIVDDQPDNLRTLSKLLTQEGFVVRQALNGQAALNTVQADVPDLILLDIRMPIMDGYEICSRLKANRLTQHIPVIFLSALNDVLDKARAFSMGGADYITKPFQIEEVLVRIQHQLTIRSQQQQLLNLNQRLQHLNVDLERRVQVRTLELEQALTLERTLKRISDEVRDTLDQNQILQTVVTELAKALECHCCNAVLYSPDRLTSTVRYEYVQPGQVTTQGQTLYIADTPKIYEQLHQQHWFAFCQVQPASTSDHSAILACPIFDDQVERHGILGELWILKPMLSSFSEQEIHLVEQVANQCAIALRQAQLYDASQNQIKELERLNQLKNDFLSTISHELRSPLANMKMALQLIDALTFQGQILVEQLLQSPTSSSKVIQYFEILKQECDRELQLVNDLLDLQHLEAGTHALQPTTINLHGWLNHIVEAFYLRAQEQQQHLRLTIDPDLPALTIDLLSLSRIVTELLMNACKYTPAHETIMISADVKQEILSLQVCNTGVEIAPKELSRVFDKFYRIPNNDPWKHGGTGLGLALTKKLVEQLDGAIEATSQNNVTCFTVRLPLRSPRH
ncbi:response regulator [Oscillatoria sp. FACHB-1407]|uniref:response regulator n=1 Tax=Oscillatoria sp. FACHB-1407 TaxID=2692847 RepID=UPI0016854891|nr:response regulator [Oscillatoria sp. FACHB-1407]MBD2464734.1 response regulator [Oscillatoria sp. FACHB-1407]